MKKIITTLLILLSSSPAFAVKTQMFKVLNTCAKYRIKELSTEDTLIALKLNSSGSNKDIDNQLKISRYCEVFTPNQNIKY
tara:strand:+ start:369 stop:611 length:243 start_codon:yes stop_codon:yes gene_type:complete